MQEMDSWIRLSYCPIRKVCYVNKLHPLTTDMLLFFNCVAAASSFFSLSDPSQVSVSSFDVEKRGENLCANPHVDLWSDGLYIPVYGSSRKLGGTCRPSDFEYGRILGKGGLGTVRIATHRPTGQKVAVKFVRTKYNDEHTYLRIRNEECLHARVNSPLIADFYCSMVSKDGSEVMYVIELVDGETLKDLSRRDPGAKRMGGHRAIATIANQISRAIEHLHDCDIILRDVKPGNIMIDRRGKIKVIDFGLAEDLRRGMWKHGNLIYREGGVVTTRKRHPRKSDVESSLNYHNAVEGETIQVADAVPFHLNKAVEAPQGPRFEQIRRHYQHTTWVDYYGMGVVLYELYTAMNYKEAHLHRGEGKRMKHFTCFDYMNQQACDLIDVITSSDWHTSHSLEEIRSFVRNHPFIRMG